MSFSPLSSDSEAYCRAFEAYRRCSQKLSLTTSFFMDKLPAHLKKIHLPDSDRPIRVLGIGSGSGAKDLVLFKQLLLTFPTRTIAVDIFEPGAELTDIFRKSFDSAKFDQRLSITFHLKTSQEFRKEEPEEAKYDFIYILDSLYYEDSIPIALIDYFERLSPGGMLLLSITTSNSGWHRTAKVYSPDGKLTRDFIGSDEIREGLETIPKELGARWEEFELPNPFDVSSIFNNTEGDEAYAVMEFVSHVANFKLVATNQEMDDFKELVRNPEVSEVTSEGRVLLRMPFTLTIVQKPFGKSS